MDAFLHQFQHLKIQLEEITSATNNFDDKNNRIGVGGFGKVYKGEVSHSKGRSMVAIKRLNPKNGQGIPEFLKEITTLSRYRHENLITLLGYCYQGNEMILVYEYASRGSLDRHLNSPHLKWSQRIKICLDAAKGLSYLHDPGETHQRLIHCDVKSANILLDDQWNAKVSDFGLSIMGPANEQNSVIVTLAAGTLGYLDPQYEMTHTLTKESDVYSFGVVLFEVLCGTFCCTYRNGRVQQNFLPTWIESYKENKLNDIIFKSPTTTPMGQGALETFSDIAYRCLKEAREDRPTMAEVVTELETALDSQKLSEGKPLVEYKEMAKTAEPPLDYNSTDELKTLLSKGVLLNGGKTFFSLNKKGEHCEMISIAECLGSELKSKPRPNDDSRFAVGTYPLKNEKIKTRVKSQFLSPGITYTVNLVLIFPYLLPCIGRNSRRLSLKYRLQGETETSVSHLAYKREDGCWMCELYQFTCDHRFVHLQILFEGFYTSHSVIEAEGIEFRPLEKVEPIDEKQPNSDSEANWEEKLPIDYEDIIKWSTESMQWTTKKEAYSGIRKGFLINDSKKRSIWFSLDKNGKKCHLLSALAAGIFAEQKYWLSLPESRFGEAVQCDSHRIFMETEVHSSVVSPETTYAIYLVYKFPKAQSRFQALVKVEEEVYIGPGDNNCPYIYLVSPQTPVIRPKDNQNTHNPLNKPKMKGFPQQRNDGWMEVQIWEFQTDTITTETIDVHLHLTTCDAEKLSRLIIEGFEFRPI